MHLQALFLTGNSANFNNSHIFFDIQSIFFDITPLRMVSVITSLI